MTATTAPCDSNHLQQNHHHHHGIHHPWTDEFVLAASRNDVMTLQRLHSITQQKATESYLPLLVNGKSSYCAGSWDDHTALQVASFEGHVETVLFLLQSATTTSTSTTNPKHTPVLDVNAVSDRFQKTALHCAAHVGREAVLGLLLRCPALALHKTNYRGQTALHAAVLYHNFPAVYMLVQAIKQRKQQQVPGSSFSSSGARQVDVVNARDQDGWTALQYAIAAGHVGIVKCLLCEGNADPTIRDGVGNTALHTAVREYCGSNVILELLMETTTNDKTQRLLHMRDHQGETALHKAVQRGDKAVVRCLLGHGANVQTPDGQGRTALHLAVCCKVMLDKIDQLEIVQALLEYASVDTINSKDYGSRTPLHWAVNSRSDVRIVRLLRRHKAHLHVTDMGGCTPVHRAIHRNCVDLIPVLLEPQEHIEHEEEAIVAAVNMPDKCGMTALQYAITDLGHVETVRNLCQRYANPNLLHPKTGCTALHSALQQTNGNAIGMLQVLLEHGGDDSIRDDQGRTPLALACELGQLDTVWELYRHGVGYGEVQLKVPLDLSS